MRIDFLKEKKLRFIEVILVFVFAFVASSCYTPSPLYGKWSDNKGNTISFIDSGEYNATFISRNVETQYTGEWAVVDNVLIITKDTGSTFTTEWDIRGAILYLNWVDNYGNNLVLNLYHTAK